MAEFNNHFDKTVWDPTDPERAIEDPMHGPSAIHRLLQTPPMPLGDGRFYQPGGMYVLGTPYVDREGNPLPLTIGRAGNTSRTMRESMALGDWVDATGSEVPLEEVPFVGVETDSRRLQTSMGRVTIHLLAYDAPSDKGITFRLKRNDASDK